MSELDYARAQMGLSLAFHIVFAAVGVALPLLMVMADARYLRTRDPDWIALSKLWAKGTSVLFAVGAVSGTVLSFELGLLWPTFMRQFGEVVGLAFAMEGFAFFTEAIFLGIYLYGRGRISPGAHLASGIAVALSGALSAAFVTLVNAQMNLPSGFTWRSGVIGQLNLSQALWPPSAATQIPHVLLSCYEATAFAMVGIHAWALLRHPASTLHRKALALALPLACVTAVLQPLSGDRSAKHVAHHQTWKLGAMEAHFQTARDVPLIVGGAPDEDRREIRGALRIPYGLSFLSDDDPHAEVAGLDRVPRAEWPPVARVHFAFDLMVGCGTLLALFAVWTGVRALRRQAPWSSRSYLRAAVLFAPLGGVALEAGWMVTEWGRQPFVVRGLLRTQDAVTPLGALAPPFWIFTVVYLALGAAVLFLLLRQIRGSVQPEGSRVT